MPRLLVHKFPMKVGRFSLDKSHFFAHYCHSETKKKTFLAELEQKAKDRLLRRSLHVESKKPALPEQKDRLDFRSQLRTIKGQVMISRAFGGDASETSLLTPAPAKLQLSPSTESLVDSRNGESPLWSRACVSYNPSRTPQRCEGTFPVLHFT
jgi:hypothetical protein